MRPEVKSLLGALAFCGGPLLSFVCGLGLLISYALVPMNPNIKGFARVRLVLAGLFAVPCAGLWVLMLLTGTLLGFGAMILGARVIWSTDR